MKTKLSVGRPGLGPPGSSTIEAPVTRALAFENAVNRRRSIPAAGDWAGAVATGIVTAV